MTRLRLACLATIVSLLWAASRLPAQTIVREVYTNITGSAVVNLTTATNFPYFPNLRTYPTNFEAPVNFGDNYGTRLRGYVVAPSSGDYVFWIASDDQSELYLSSNDLPENKRLIARVNASTTSREWTKEANQQSAPVPLEAGQRYYIEALHKEGTGSDHVAVGWQLPNGVLERPIPGGQLRPWPISTNAPSITGQPKDLTISDEESASFHVDALGAEPLGYQWQRDGHDLERETTALLELEAVSLLDNGAAFRCIISNSLGSVTSRVATLTVYAETNPPVIVALNPPAGATVRQLAQIEVTFSEPVQGVSAGDLLVNGQPATNVFGISPGPFTFQFTPQPPGWTVLGWADGHGITDFSVASNSFGGGPWLCRVNPASVLPEVVITEFLAANENGWRDEEGELQDWIELQNRSAVTVDLAGWSLSDDERNPGKWVFPPRSLGPGGFLVVFASGKDRKPAGTNALHTNFKLGSDGEFLGLFAPEVPRLPACQLTNGFPEQRNDCSYGLDPAGQWRYFAVPTPGANNGWSTITGVVESVHCSVERGLFNQPFTLVLSTHSPEAVIRFTTDGSEPTLSNGVAYVAPLTISTTTVFRAAAFKDNCLPSRASTHTYFFGLSPALLSLPIMSLVTGSNNLIGPTGIIGISGGYYSNNVWYASTTNDYHNPRKYGIAWERPVSAELIHPADNGGFQVDCGLRVHGGASIRPRYTPTSKFSFRLYFRGDYGPGKLEYPFFTNSPVTTFDQIVLRAGMNDPVNPFIRDELVRRLGNDAGRVDPIGGVVNLFINGEYKGYYNPTERVHSSFMQAHHGGGEDWDVITLGSKVQEGDAVEWNSLRAFVSSADVTQPAIFQEIERRLDLPSFVDYLLLYNCSGCGDWPHNNWRAGRERATNGIFRFYVWDAEWSWGFNNRSPSLNMFTNELSGTTEVATLYKRLRLNPEFNLLFADRVQKQFFNGGAFTDEHILYRHNELSNLVRGVIANFNPTIATNWVPRRRAYLLAQMAEQGLLASSNAPVFSRHGSVVPPGWRLAMTNLSGAIWFTTNGIDPRERFTGAVAPGAQAWTNGMSLPLFSSPLVKARSLAGTNWSAVTEATFSVGLLGAPIRITEVMYHPLGGEVYEFIELRNLSAAPVDVSGFRFSGVTFQFPTPSVIPGGATIVLSSATDPAAFAARYPEVIVQGRFTGSLDNGGERLALLDRDGNIVTSLDYNDAGGWPTAADGSGASLQMINVFGEPDDPANWQASPQPAGSPGVADNLTAPPPVVRLNEIAALNAGSVANGTNFPDWVELHNASPDAADLTDWSLTDDGNPRKFVFPPGTTLAAGAFLVVWCDADTNAPGLHSGFALDADGESVFLFNASTARVDAISFGRQLADFTIGRIDSEWRLTLPTPNATNRAAATASVSNLVINEWMANPLPGQSDWIELYNRHSTLPVALRGLYVGNGKAVDQVRPLSFIAPNGFLVLFLDQHPGTDHLDIKLPAEGSPILLCDETGTEFQRVTNAAQVEGVSRGRTPDGADTLADFPGEATPGAPNSILTPSSVTFTEVLAVNVTAVTNARGRVAGFFEVGNTAATNVNLAGMGISADNSLAPQWQFPPNTMLAPGGFLAVWCDPARPASTNNESVLNCGCALPRRSGALHLFATSGRLVDSVVYGPQVADRPGGLSGGYWRLLSAPTPGAANATPAFLGSPTSLRFNEWMSSAGGDEDWFELFNLANLPVELAGLYLTDDPSLAGRTKYRVPPLSFIGPNGFVKFEADAEPAKGAHHASFKLDADGEPLLLLNQDFSLIDAVYVGAAALGISEGRLPDGSTNVIAFPGTASPEFSNWRPYSGVVINEVLARAEPPLEDAVELLNTGAGTANLGGWFLSDSRDNLRKFRIPDGTGLASGAFAVFYQNQFGAGPNAFTLDGAQGGELWLSPADAAGNLTGLRVRAAFGATARGVSAGRFDTSLGTDFVCLSARTFGADQPQSLAEFRTGAGRTNAVPLVGPVVISEILYHAWMPTNATLDDEFVELHNLASNALPLFDPEHPANTWQLTNAVGFAFPSGVTLQPGEFVLVVNFDPVLDPAALFEFLSKHNLGPEVRIFGPFAGRLANEGDCVDLYRPDTPQPAGAPDAGLVPWLLVDRVNYGAAFPWPGSWADGNGASLQRRDLRAYGNEPFNWAATLPTPGATNNVGALRPPVITQQPASLAALEGTNITFTVAVDGEDPLLYQWRRNGLGLAGQTNATLTLSQLNLADSGTYDVVIGNQGGVLVSAPAVLKVLAPPRFTLRPDSQTAASNATVTFQAAAVGTEPLQYQWSFNGNLLPEAAGPSLVISNANCEDIGAYQVTVWNEVGVTNATAGLTVLVRPILLEQPQSQTALEGQNVTFSIMVTGAPPFGFRWRRYGTTLAPFGTGGLTFTLTNVQLLDAGTYTVIVTNPATVSSGVISSPAVLTVFADFDRDGQSDAWEAQYGFNTNNAADALLDADRDMLNNRQEYLAGTHPLDALDYLKIDQVETAAGHQAVVQFHAVANRSYTLQCADTLPAAAWTNAARFNARDTNWTVRWTNTAAGGARFYRLVVP